MAGNRLYMWEEWFALGKFTLVRGKHYTCSQSSMQQQVRSNASARGVGTSIRDLGDRLVVEVTAVAETKARKPARTLFR